jgi:hypothetical protein
MNCSPLATVKVLDPGTIIPEEKSVVKTYAGQNGEFKVFSRA